MLGLKEQMTTYSGFSDGTSWYTLNLASTCWVLYSPTSNLVRSGRNCLGPSTNNIADYYAVIGLLIEALTNGVSHIKF